MDSKDLKVTEQLFKFYGDPFQSLFLKTEAKYGSRINIMFELVDLIFPESVLCYSLVNVNTHNVNILCTSSVKLVFSNLSQLVWWKGYYMYMQILNWPNLIILTYMYMFNTQEIELSTFWFSCCSKS